MLNPPTGLSDGDLEEVIELVTEVLGFRSLSEKNRQTFLREIGEWINGPLPCMSP